MKEVESTLTRLIDFLKSHQVTLFFTSLTHGNLNLEEQRGRNVIADGYLDSGQRH